MPDETVSTELTLAPVEPAATEQEPRPEPHVVEEVPEQGTTLSEYLESLLVTVILALFGTSFVVQAFKIPSPSMEKTLLVGDHLLVNKFIFGGRGQWYDKIWDYSWTHFVDHKYGAWYRILTPDNRKYSDEKSPAGKVDYHTMGACYEVLNVIN